MTPGIHYLQPQHFTYFSNPARFWTREVTVARAGISKCTQSTGLWEGLMCDPPLQRRVLLALTGHPKTIMLKRPQC